MNVKNYGVNTVNSVVIKYRYGADLLSRSRFFVLNICRGLVWYKKKCYTYNSHHYSCKNVFLTIVLLTPEYNVLFTIVILFLNTMFYLQQLFLLLHTTFHLQQSTLLLHTMFYLQQSFLLIHTMFYLQQSFLLLHTMFYLQSHPYSFT